MAYGLPLDSMTLSEKLRAMEAIWDDLSRGTETLPSPGWHRDVLQARELRVAEGSSRYQDWDQAKKDILKQAQ